MNSLHRQGFTLIEMLGVTSIIAMLASILMPVFSNAREKARQTMCISNQRQIAMATTMSLQDHEESYPDSADYWKTLDIDRKVLSCPTSDEKVDQQNQIGYAYSQFVAGRSNGEVKTPASEILITDGKSADNILREPADFDFRHQESVVATFCDCHAERVQVIPPMWITDLQTEAEFNDQIRQNSYPVLVFFFRDATEPDSVSKTFCNKLAPTIVKIAAENRLRLRTVFVNSEHFFTLTNALDILPDDEEKGCPVILLYNKKEEMKRYAGYDKKMKDYDHEEWAELIAASYTEISTEVKKYVPK